jgi:hypothetical protein
LQGCHGGTKILVFGFADVSGFHSFSPHSKSSGLSPALLYFTQVSTTHL